MIGGVSTDDRNAPATKGDLADMEERVMERLRDIETKLLNVYGFARSDDKDSVETE